MKADVGSEPGALGARDRQRAATRERVLTAARALFDADGYQATTIRQIASRAGVSVGTVFTTFPSKSSILSQVMQDRLTALYAELDHMAPHLRGSTADRLRSIFAIHFAFEAPHIRLFLAHIAAAYDPDILPSDRPYGRTPRLQEITRECLIKGVAAGDVDPKADLQEIIDLLVAAYAWTYRLAASQGATADEMTAVMERQIGVISEGFAPRR